MNKSLQSFYENFITTMYGFVLVFGFGRFLEILGNSEKVSVYILLVAAYINVIHFWLVFVAATRDTFVLIESPANPSDSKRMSLFWIEISFVTLLTIPMLLLFMNLESVRNFAGTMVLIAVWSLLWDFWAFHVNQHLVRKRRKVRSSLRAITKEALRKWIGLDILFVLFMLLIYEILMKNEIINETLLAIAMLGISFFGALLDTVMLNPTLYLSNIDKSN